MYKQYTLLLLTGALGLFFGANAGLLQKARMGIGLGNQRLAQFVKSTTSKRLLIGGSATLLAILGWKYAFPKRAVTKAGSLSVVPPRARSSTVDVLEKGIPLSRLDDKKLYTICVNIDLQTQINIPLGKLAPDKEKLAKSIVHALNLQTSVDLKLTEYRAEKLTFSKIELSGDLTGKEIKELKTYLAQFKQRQTLQYLVQGSDYTQNNKPMEEFSVGIIPIFLANKFLGLCRIQWPFLYKGNLAITKDQAAQLRDSLSKIPVDAHKEFIFTRVTLEPIREANS